MLKNKAGSLLALTIDSPQLLFRILQVIHDYPETDTTSPHFPSIPLTDSLYTTMMHKLIEYRIKIPQKEVLEKKLTIIAQKHRNFEEALHYYQTRHEQSLGGESAEALLCPPEALSIEANFQAILTGNNLEDIPSTDADLASKGHKQEEKATADDFVTENEENLDIDTEIDDDGFDFVDDDGFGFDDQEETKRTLEESEEMGEKRVRITNDGSDDGIVLPPPVFRKASLLQAGDASNDIKVDS